MTTIDTVQSYEEFEACLANKIDHKYVNFSQDHEMNYHLRKVDKSQSIENRKTLRVMGPELKGKLGQTRVTHTEFHNYINTKSNLARLEDKK